MSVYCVINQTMRLSDPTRKVTLNEPLAYSNTRAHAFRVTVLAEGSSEPADLSSVGCVGQFYKLKANETVMPINGTVDAETGVAEIILPASCYTTPGRFTFTMDLSKANTAGEGEQTNAEIRTVLWVEGIVERNQDGEIIDPGTPVGNIEQAIGNANAAAAAATQAASAANQSASDADTAASEARAASAVSVRYDTAQTLSATQQEQARENIGAANAEITDQMIQPVVYWDNDGTVSNSGQSLTRIAGDHFTLNSGTVTSSVFFRVGKTLGSTTGTSTANNWVNQLTFSEGVLYTLTLKPISGTVEGGGSVRVAIEGKTVQVAQAVASVPLAGGTVNFVWPDAAKGGKIVLFTAADAVAADYEFILIMTIRTVLDCGVAVSGSTPIITAVPGVRYECGTVTELTFTPASSGLCEVVFTTGSNPTEPVLPSTVRMPDWWTGVEANRTYDIMILNGTLAGVMSWAT